MGSPRVETERLELRPMSARVAAALLVDREAASRELRIPIHDEWPQSDLLGILPRLAAASPEVECFGSWVMIERDGGVGTVVGDIGFHGPPDEHGTVELGYCVVPSRRRLGYATEAARALVEWVSRQPGVRLVVAGCDPGNVASVRTLERTGFRRNGQANGELRWRYDGEPVHT